MTNSRPGFSGEGFEQVGQLNFFPPVDVATQIPGLVYWANFISTAEEDALFRFIDAMPWLHDLKRRVQHYGYRYDYKARAITSGLYLGALPDWAAAYCKKLCDAGIFAQQPDQVIVNEYLPGQGIAPHIDCVPCFSETVVSLSLGSACVMGFAQAESGLKASTFLEPRSLLVLTGDARYHWTHAIAPRKSDQINGRFVVRQRRVSLTFRKVMKN